jgi:hypothetical protein
MTSSSMKPKWISRDGRELKIGDSIAYMGWSTNATTKIKRDCLFTARIVENKHGPLNGMPYIMGWLGGALRNTPGWCPPDRLIKLNEEWTESQRILHIRMCGGEIEDVEE